jgi:phospholipase C
LGAVSTQYRESLVLSSQPFSFPGGFPVKLATKALLSLTLSLFLCVTLIAQSKPERSKPQTFPSQIQHVIVIFQENRTPDNLFQGLSPLCTIPQGATGLASCTPNPVTTSCYDVSPCGVSNQSKTDQPFTLAPVLMKGSSDPSHAHSAFEMMCDADSAHGYICRNDGAWKIKPANDSYAYVENTAVTNYNNQPGTLLGPYLYFAQQYGWANYMYQTNQGPSNPAHQFIFTGTSAASTLDDMNSTFQAENLGAKGSSYGCLASAGARISFISPLLPGNTLCTGGKSYDGKSVQECPVANTALNNPPGNPVGTFCYNKPTMGTLLDAVSVSWKYYAPSAGSIWTAPNAIQDLCVPQFTSSSDTTLECTGAEWASNVDLTLKGADILNDINNCKLSGVSWAIPDGTWSDHAGITGNYGPSWVAAIINAVGGQGNSCGYWKNTAVVVTWDDWGGWSDNQVPPLASPLPCTSSSCQGDYQYGFRVPLLVVSAYTQQGFITNTQYDFGSILRMIEGIFNVPGGEGALGVADARATADLSEFFQGSQPTYTVVPALEPASYFTGKKAQEGPPAPPDNDGDDD